MEEKKEGKITAYLASSKLPGQKHGTGTKTDMKTSGTE
jgi:hypothetical protein